MRLALLMTATTPTPAVVLLSGGLDSATCLAAARDEGFAAHALAFDYGQRHRCELDAARRVAAQLGAASFRVVNLGLREVGGSALTADLEVPKDRATAQMSHGVPITYVPARNLSFLSIGAGLAETLGAMDMYIGVNAVDYSGYPDCRREFIDAFERAANLGTAIGTDEHARRGFRVHTPLVTLTKAQIIKLGVRLGVDYSLTTSCYDPDAAGRACGHCDSCQIRRKGFADAGVDDPTVYQPGA